MTAPILALKRTIEEKLLLARQQQAQQEDALESEAEGDYFGEREHYEEEEQAFNRGSRKVSPTGAGLQSHAHYLYENDDMHVSDDTLQSSPETRLSNEGRASLSPHHRSLPDMQSCASAILVQHRLEELLLDIEQDMATTHTALGVVLKMVVAKEDRHEALDRFHHMCDNLHVLDDVSVPEGLQDSAEVLDLLNKASSLKRDLRRFIDLLTYEPEGSQALQDFSDHLHSAYNVPRDGGTEMLASMEAAVVRPPSHLRSSSTGTSTSRPRDVDSHNVSSLSVSASEEAESSKDDKSHRLQRIRNTSGQSASPSIPQHQPLVATSDGASVESSVFSIPSPTHKACETPLSATDMPMSKSPLTVDTSSNSHPESKDKRSPVTSRSISPSSSYLRAALMKSECRGAASNDEDWLKSDRGFLTPPRSPMKSKTASPASSTHQRVVSDLSTEQRGSPRHHRRYPSDDTGEPEANESPRNGSQEPPQETGIVWREGYHDEHKLFYYYNEEVCKLA